MLTSRQQATPEVTEFVAVLRTAFGETVDDAFARGKVQRTFFLPGNGRTNPSRRVNP